MPKNEVLFDLDGTLVDTEEQAAEAIVQAYLRWNRPISIEKAWFVAGRKWEAAFDELFPKYPPPHGAEAAGREIIQIYESMIQSGLTEVVGARDAVAALFKGGCSLALVSGSKRAHVEYALQTLKIRDFFQIVLGAEDYRESKPSPEGYLLAMKALGVDSRNTVIFEDSTAGITSGKASGAFVVAISSTNHDKHDISHADYQISDLRGVDTNWIQERIKGI